MSQDDSTHFGFDTVRLGEKQARVDSVFHAVAKRYDVMNDAMSAGLHRLWKNMMVSRLHVPASAAYSHLDVAGGTGDIAFRILENGGPKTSVTVLDINAGMLGVGRERALERFGDDPRIDFIEANAEELPFPDNSFDGYTIAFGIRNVPRIEKALAEAYRVLGRGGRFLCLEFSRVDVPLLDKIYDAYSFNIIPEMGRLIADDADSYRYLVESIRRFPPPEAFADMIRAAGFARVDVSAMTGGVVALHSGWKL
jgi:demethylmenaquinone methyltransferase / 2-methoxy-6-polyprenyl-1,4-benzoquinol methylase